MSTHLKITSERSFNFSDRSWWIRSMLSFPAAHRLSHRDHHTIKRFQVFAVSSDILPTSTAATSAAGLGQHALFLVPLSPPTQCCWSNTNWNEVCLCRSPSTLSSRPKSATFYCKHLILFAQSNYIINSAKSQNLYCSLSLIPRSVDFSAHDHPVLCTASRVCLDDLDFKPEMTSSLAQTSFEQDMWYRQWSARHVHPRRLD